MKVAVIPNLDKRGAAEVIEKLGIILKKETNKLEELIKWKKGLLQQMFV